MTILSAVAATGLTISWAQSGSGRSQTAGSTQSSSGKDTQEIVLDKCRIKLKKQAILAADRPGILESIKFKEGQSVKASNVVAALKADVAIAAHNVAVMKAKDETEIEYAIKARDQAEQEVKKAREVNGREPGTISPIEIQRLVLEWEKAVASVKKSTMQKTILGEQAKEAKAQLDTFQVVAPFDGIVKTKLKSEGEAVRQGDPILEIVNTDTVVVEGYLDYRDRPRIKLGNKVTVQLQDWEDETSESFTLSGKTYPGKIVFIDQIVQARTKKIFIKAEIANPNKTLYPGLTARMTIVPGTQVKK